MYDRFLVLLRNGQTEYTLSFYRLIYDIDVVDILKQERTFDNGKTFIEVTIDQSTSNSTLTIEYGKVVQNFFK